MFKLSYNCTHFTCLVKIMFKILQQYMNWELMDVQAGFRKGRGTRDQIVNSRRSQKKQGNPSKTSTSVSLTTLKPFTVWTTTDCWKFLEMEIPDHLTCLLRNLNADQEATVRSGHETKNWFQIGKEVYQGCIMSPCLFSSYAEYIMRKAGQMKQKLESRLLWHISITTDMQMTPPFCQKVKRN